MYIYANTGPSSSLPSPLLSSNDNPAATSLLCYIQLSAWSRPFCLSVVSPSRDVNNPRDSRFFERRKEEDPVRRGGDRYYGAGVDWMDASLLKVDSTRAPRLNLNRTFLPALDDGHNDSEEMRGVELRKRTIEYSSRIEPVHIARTSGTSSERRRKAALEGREASRVRVRMQELWRAHQRSPTRSGRDTE
ncbi:hypothetical protein B0H13DRAFT_1876541 [Mycena leptocephala]|nr:hypothetical protein B0H13DRAFT_1876541 [Mycena leptocephala]